MGFRQKIKGKIKKLIGYEEALPPVVVREEQPVSPPKEPAIDIAPVTEVHSPQESKPETVEKKDETVDDAKVAKHLQRTKKGILKFVEKNGGTCGLADMHDHSEKRFFVGHRKFSDLMEGMVEEGLLSYSWESQEAMITQEGREWIGQ